MTIGSLFSGIGGLELGLEWAGLGPTLWQVEIDERCRNSLAEHWPDAEQFGDIHFVSARQLKPVELLCGGFPCQDISSAGKRRGLSGYQSGLWREFQRVVKELHPSWVVVENVASGATKWVDRIRDSLAELGYASFPVPFEARFVGLRHERARVFIVAHSLRKREQRIQSGRSSRKNRKNTANAREVVWREVEPILDGALSRIPGRMDRERSLGNSVAPPCAEVIGWIIRELSK